jgi:hypothetical protein
MNFSDVEDIANKDRDRLIPMKLTAKARKKIKTSSFALPGRRYPIEDRSHAQNAKARVSQFGTPAEKAKVNAAVKRRYGFKKGRAGYKEGSWDHFKMSGC